MRYLKQSTSADVPIGPFLDNVDGFTAETALTITQPDIRVKKNGGAWAQKAAAQTLTHEETGFYEVTLDATDTDTIGLLRLAVNKTGALPVWEDFHVLAANVYDSLFGAATDKLDVNVEEWNTTAVPAEYTAGYPIVTIKDGIGTGEINTNAGAIAVVDLVMTTTTATNVTTVNGLAANVITAASVADGAIDRLTFAADTGLQSVRSNTAQAGSATSITLDASASATTDFYAGDVVYITGGTGVGQARLCTAYNGTTKVATVTPAWATNPDVTSTFAVLPATWVQGSVTLTTYTSNTPQTGDAFARLGAPAGASVSADILVIDNFVDGLEATIGAAGAGLTAVPWNAAWDAEVESEVNDALVAQRLDELLNADSDIDGVAPPTVGSVFHELMSKTALSFTFDQTTDSLEAIRDRGDVSWITATGFSTLDAAGVRSAVGLAAANLDTQLTAIDDFLDTEIAAIKTATDQLAFTAGRVNAVLAVTPAVAGDAMALTAAYDFAKGTVAMTEAYAANGVAPTPVQALFALHGYLMTFAISGVNSTVKKLDGATTAFVVTINDATTPTAATRA